METDGSETRPVWPGSKLHHMPVVDRHSQRPGPNEEEILQPNTMLASGDFKRFHFFGPNLAHDSVIDDHAVEVPKAHERGSGLVDLDHRSAGHPSMMHEVPTLGIPDVSD